jgi:hypothetical protein
MNVADSLPRRRLPRVIVWSLAVSVVAIVALGLLAAGVSILRRRATTAAMAPTATAEVVRRQAAVPGATVSPEVELGVYSRYPDGPPVPTASIGEATAAADRIAPSPTPGTPPAAAARTATAIAASSGIPPEIGGGGSLPAERALSGSPAADAGSARDRDGAAARIDRATPVPREGLPVWEAAYLLRQPQIDGSLAEWRIEPYELRAVVFGEEFWEGPKDLGATVFLGWDEESLYLGARITDEAFSQPGTGAELYLGDSLELQVDTQLDSDREEAIYSDDDWQIGLSPGDFDLLEPEVYVWRPGGTELAGVNIASQRLNDGYIVEAAIPWSSIEMEPTQVGAIGLALNVSDNDVRAPAQLTMISSSPDRSWSDPRTFGTLLLVR